MLSLDSMKRLALLFTFVAACGGVGPRVTSPVRVADSRLVPVNPDVKTVVDASQPVFFVRGSYWLFNDGRWFRTARLDGDWQYVKKPPVPVAQINQPFAYVHYRKTAAGTAIETIASGYQGQGEQTASSQPEQTASSQEPQPAQPKPRPAQERQPAAVDPSVDPTVNLAPMR